MYMQRILVRPAVGKAPEVRSLLEERVKARQAQGVAQGLQATLFNPEGATFVATTRWEDLAKYEQDRGRNQGDPAFRAYQTKLAGLITVPPAPLLFEVLIGPAPGTPTGKYQTRITNRPAVGKVPELRALLEERVKALRAQGMRRGLLARLFDPEGGSFVIVASYDNLGEWEQQRDRQRNDPATREFQAKLSGLVSRPPQPRLFEVLVRMPPAQ